MSDSDFKLGDKQEVVALRREHASLLAELARLKDEESALLVEHSTNKADYFARISLGRTALTDVDLNRRQDREKILLESASRLEYLIGNDMAPCYRVNSEGGIVSANNACARLLGYSHESFYDGSLTVGKIVPVEYLILEKECAEELKDLIVSGTIVTERIAASGKRVPVACNFRLTRADGGQWAVFLMDLSEARAMEEELKRRQALFSTLVSEMPNMIFLVDEGGRTWQFNRRFYELTGLDPAEENGFFPAMVAHPDDMEMNAERWRGAIKDHQPLEGEVRVRGLNGEYYWHIFRAIPLSSPLPGQMEGLIQLARAVCPHATDGYDIDKHRFWIGTSTDIDSRKCIIDDVLESAYNFQSLADQIPQIVWTAGPDGRIDFFNNRWFEFSGLSRDHKVGMDFALFIHADDRRLYVSTWKNCVKTGDALDVEFRLKKKARSTADFDDADYEKFLARAVAVRNQRGDIEQWVGTWTSI